MDARGKRRGGMYWDGGLPYVSVTKVLSVIDKGNGLMYWFGKEIYYALAKNPSLGEKEALRAPYNTTEKAANRGKLVHSAIEAFKQSGVRVKAPEKYQGYINAFYKWIDEVKPEILESEKTVFSRKHRYAGTCDALVKINEKIYLVDFKTNKDGLLYDEVELQLSAYLSALRESGVKVDGALAVALGSDGNYHPKEAGDCFEVFLACKVLWAWKNKAICEKINYVS